MSDEHQDKRAPPGLGTPTAAANCNFEEIDRSRDNPIPERAQALGWRLITNHQLENLIAARAGYGAARRGAERVGREITPQLRAALGELADARGAWLRRRPDPAAPARWLWRVAP